MGVAHGLVTPLRRRGGEGQLLTKLEHRGEYAMYDVHHWPCLLAEQAPVCAECGVCVCVCVCVCVQNVVCVCVCVVCVQNVVCCVCVWF